MAIVLPTSKEIKQLIGVLEEIRDIDQQRLAVEQELVRLARYDHFAQSFVFTQQIPGQPPLKGATMLVLTDIQSCHLTIQPVDAKGNPAPVDGVPQWSVSDPTILSLTVAADGMSADVSAIGPLGVCQVNVTADADLGAGVVTIAGTLDTQVNSSQATGLNISAGTPTP